MAIPSYAHCLAQRKVFLFFFFCLSICADQFAKLIIVRTAPQDGFFPGSLLNLRVIMNEGIAFGIPLHGVFLPLLFIIVLFVFVIFSREFARAHPLPLTLLFAGAISNLLDRFVRGAVVDYVEFWVFPVFNIADVFIIVSIVFLLLRKNHLPARVSK